jgi:precorrin-3B synthase
MSAPIIKGWCPGALRPMVSGDGLVVRVRPRAGRLSSAQVLGLADLAERYGNGLIDLSSRANVQLRGISVDGSEALLDGLRALDLLDADAKAEARRNVIVTPFWQAGDSTEELALALSDALVLAEGLVLPGKFGFAVDCGPVPVLARDPADIRIERDAEGRLILCAEGHEFGRPITRETAVAEALELAAWFARQGSDARRMRALIMAGHDLPRGYDIPRQLPEPKQLPQVTAAGALVALAFGQVSAATFATLGARGPIRTTPWRMVLLEGSGAADLPDLISDANDPLLRVVACTGAPGCGQALGDTRGIARKLAPHVAAGRMLHVSGCAKGCAHPKIADLTLCASAAGYDLIHDGRPGGDASSHDLNSDDILQLLKKAT